MRYLTIFILAAVLAVQGTNQSRVPKPEGPCCLCECMSADQSRCSRMCVRLQHGKKIVEYPQIKVCTRSCERVPVKKIDMSYMEVK